MGKYQEEVPEPDSQKNIIDIFRLSVIFDTALEHSHVNTNRWRATPCKRLSPALHFRRLFGYSTDTFLYLSPSLLSSQVRTFVSFLSLKLYISGIHLSKRRLQYNSLMSVNTGKYLPDKRLEEICLRRMIGWEVTSHRHQ